MLKKVKTGVDVAQLEEKTGQMSVNGNPIIADLPTSLPKDVQERPQIVAPSVETPDVPPVAPSVETPVIQLQQRKTVTKLKRVPNLDLAVDPILAQIVRDYDAEREALKREFEEKGKAKAKIIAKILSMNAIELRVNTEPFWREGMDILSVPLPDVVVAE